MRKHKTGKKVMRRFVKMLAPWRMGIIAAIVLVAAATICGVFGPNLLGQMTNVAVESLAKNGALDFGGISAILVQLIVLYVVAAGLSYVSGVIFARVSGKMAAKMRAEILEKIARMPMRYFDQHKIGDTISRVSTDVRIMTDTFATVMNQIVSAATTLVGIMVIMVTISASLAVVALLVVPLSVILIAKVAKKAQKQFRLQQKMVGELSGVTEEDFAGQILIKVNGAAKRAEAKFEDVNRNLTGAAWRAQFLSSLAYPITHVITNLNYVAICVLGGRMAIDGALMIGSVQAFLQYVSQFNRPITEVSQIASSLQQTLAAAERVFEFLDEKEEPADYEPAQKIAKVRGAVEFKNVNFGYENPDANGKLQRKEVIKDFSVKIEPGMQVAIVGPTGVGKTTIINLLMRFYDPDSGYILVDDVPIAEMRRADVRKMFGMVLQDTWLFSGTVEENLRYGRPDASHEEIVAAAKACHVQHFIESLPKNYATEISEDSDNISAGEKQLLTIVRAMVANPPMMILDEATSNVDTRTEQLIQRAFQKLTHGRTSFVIAHRLSTIRNADLIIVMKDGGIAEQGTHKELLAKNGEYAELYRSQFAE